MCKQNNLYSKVVGIADCQEHLLGNSKHPELQALYQEGWRILINSANNNLTQKYHYRAVAFINKRTLEVHVAHAGNLVINFYDLWDDVKLLYNQIPSKLVPLKFFVNRMINKLGGSGTASRYTFSSSGHSLGAILSDLMAAELMSRGLLFYQSCTFKNPGSCKIVERAIEKNCLSGWMSLQIVKQHCREYSIKRNFFNTFKSCLKDVVQLVKIKINFKEIVGLPKTQSFSVKILLEKINPPKLIELINQQLSDPRTVDTQISFAATFSDDSDFALSASSLSNSICSRP